MSTGIILAKLDEMKFDEPLQLWGPAIQQSTLNLIYAPRGYGKTFFALQLLHAIGSGSPFLKWRGAGRQRCIYFDGEMGLRVMARRFQKADEIAAMSVNAHSVKVITYADCPNSQLWNLSDPKMQKLYEGEFNDWPVIVIDNLLTASFPSDRWDDDVKQWQRIQPFLVRMRDSGKTIILVHHAGKAGGQLGTSQRENIMDTIMALKPSFIDGQPSDIQFNLVFEKHRHFYGKDAEPMRIRFQGDRWHWDSAEGANIEAVRKLLAERQGVRAIAEVLGVNLMEAMRLIDKARETGQPLQGDENDF